jgi:hypothetical protein
VKSFLAGLLALVPALLAAAPDDAKPAAEPVVSLVLGPAQGKATPSLHGSARAGGGNIHVTQPSPDTLSVTMTGAVVAKGHPLKHSAADFALDLEQGFEVVYHCPHVKGAKLILWGRVIGALRSDCHCCKSSGSAGIAMPGRASVTCGSAEVVALDLPAHAVGCGENVAVLDRAGPVWAPVVPGKYILHQAFGIAASHQKGFCCKPVSAEFAPEPALEADWLGRREPFHGVAKKDFGFQVILKVVADDDGNDQKK